MPYKIESCYKRLGKAITEAREVSGLSIDALAKGLDISRPSLYSMEAGNQRIALHLIFKMEEIFGVRNELINKARGKNTSG